jgi:uroporphyrinogen-III synthase
MAALDGLTVLVPESRELDLFAAMLEQEGAVTMRCPLVRILPLQDVALAQAFIDHCIAGEFDDLVLLTGEGLRHLVKLAGPRLEFFLSSLAKMRKIVRGPKPARALRELSLVPDVSAPRPLSEAVLEIYAPQELAGRRIAVQLYPGDGAMGLVESLRAGGAQVTTITPYRYASDADTEEVQKAIDTLLQGRIGLVAFTATPQIDRLLAVAKENHQEEVLLAALAKTPIAAVGPVVQETLARYGLSAALAPEASFHMKPFVRAIAAWRAG